MKFHIQHMNNENAIRISKWVYQEPYSMYSMDGSDSCIDELMNGQYVSVHDEQFDLIGYYCFGRSAQVPAGNQFGVYKDDRVTDIGFGLKPSLCGQGLGYKFVSHGLEFARSNLLTNKFRLTVASFNDRAIKVYLNAGFKKVSSFIRVLDHRETEFLIMNLGFI